GLIPSSPTNPTVCVTADVLEVYRLAHLRCPHLSVQAFVKTVCDLHQRAYASYLTRQFTIAFDVYQQILAEVKVRVQAALQRDSPDWRLKHACPACTYKLEDEDELQFSMLYTMDGNDSLKRYHRRASQDDDELEDIGPNTVQPSSELPTAFQLRSDRYLSREAVDKLAKPGTKSLANEEVSNFYSSSTNNDDNPCTERWKNMRDDNTKRMWGIFEETGLFASLCRHGFSLVVADMVRSGELSKYPLAVVEKLLGAFGIKLGGGYDIGCSLKTTLANSPIGALAAELKHTSLVGAFHGHAHRRLCQLWHLATYVEGLGLEDLEGCERLFSKLNALAACVRYMSALRRQQAIAAFLEHNDMFEVFANITLFILNNYKQATKMLSEGSTALAIAMQELGVKDENVFEEWLKEERVYLKGLQKEPENETLEMEYWERLDNLIKEQVSQTSVWKVDTPETMEQGRPDETSADATARRHALEKYDKELEIVHGLERRLGLVKRWTPDMPEWQEAARKVGNRKYQRALDSLEGLLVARVFELTKMNKSQTGYALRQHIGKALKARSQAICTALDRFNNIAHASGKPKLQWDEVVQYTFLSDFDLLRDARQDIRKQPWATPAGRIAMDQYFKLCRAREEIRRLNVEARRVVTYLRDEMTYLRSCEELYCPMQPSLAHQIAIHRRERERFMTLHERRLTKLAELPGFSGCLTPGVSKQREPGDSTGPLPAAPTDMAVDLEATDGNDGVETGGDGNVDRGGDEGDDDDGEGDDDEGDDDDDEPIVAEALVSILKIADDQHEVERG
ncbi:hypothetical protein CONPUDRAFT_61867, partial [Coniophora puteana RWD-64-598 SS2]